MSQLTYIRPLVLNDANTSYKWRNNPLIWKFTGSKPHKHITAKTETEWLRKCLASENEKRFAICLNSTDQYVGNIQLTNIDESEAQYHIFIGETDVWGKGIAKEATIQLLKFAFEELGLIRVWLEVNEENLSAISVYRNVGFEVQHTTKENFIKMILTKDEFYNTLKI
jgi:diamine N-acetyltransferase